MQISERTLSFIASYIGHFLPRSTLNVQPHVSQYDVRILFADISLDRVSRWSVQPKKPSVQRI